MYRIVVLGADKVITLTNRTRVNAFMRLGRWRAQYPDSYLQMAVEVVDDFGTTYILAWRTIPLVGGY